MHNLYIHICICLLSIVGTGVLTCFVIVIYSLHLIKENGENTPLEVHPQIFKRNLFNFHLDRIKMHSHQHVKAYQLSISKVT